jgi:hypothetical protein
MADACCYRRTNRGILTGTAFELWKVDISPYKETRCKPNTVHYGDTFEVSMPVTTVPLIIRLQPAVKSNSPRDVGTLGTPSFEKWP